MDKQTNIDAINISIMESERQMMQMGCPFPRATKEQALKQVEMLKAARGCYVQKEIRTDECGRILLTEQMNNSLQNAEQSLAEGICYNKEQFLRHFAKWLE